MLAAITQTLPRTICDSDLLSRHATQLATPKIMVIAKKAKYRVIVEMRSVASVTSVDKWLPFPG